MSYFTKIAYEDSGSLDAFSRLRTSQPETLLDIQQQYDQEPYELEMGATGSGVVPTYNTNTRMSTLSTTGATGTSYIQSYMYTPYEPGKSQFIAITGVLGTGVEGTTKDFGYFDSANGVIFRQSDTSLQLILRTSTSGVVSDSNLVNQANWNIDTLDGGLNPSGKIFDVTKVFILIIDLQFLGMGRVRVGFDIDGVIYYVHEFLNANNLTVPYMQSATLPIGILITATAGVGTSSCGFKCCVVQCEGGKIANNGFVLSTPEETVTAGNATRVPLISIRPKTTFKGIINRSLFILENMNLFVTGTMDIYWELVLGATITGQVWADISTGNSSFEYTSTSGTFVNLTGGTIIASGYNSRIGGTNNGTPIATPAIQSFHYPISLNRAGEVRPLGTLSLLVTGLSATSACRGSVNFKEIR